MRKLRDKSCIYCGSIENITRDHVPPRNIFPDPKPGNLITVPSCLKCNNSASKDDEYFRLLLSVRHDLFPHEGIQKNWNKVKRGLSRKESAGLKTELLKSFKLLDAYSSSGIYLGKVPAVDVDFRRIYSVVERVMKGVFYHHQKYPLPKNITTVVYSVQDMQINKKESIEVYEDILRFVAAVPLQSFGGDTFQYKVRFLEDSHHSGVFLATFYNKVAFLGLYINEVT